MAATQKPLSGSVFEATPTVAAWKRCRRGSSSPRRIA